MSFLVVIEGIDGSGKGTQAKLLNEKFSNAGVKAELLSFPRYDATRFGKAIGDFLNGRFGQLDEVNPFLVSLLYAGDRFESRELIREALEKNDLVICDRYVPSNIAHQGAKAEAEEREELVDWIQHVEFGMYELPKPDLTVLLDLPADEAQNLIALKQARNYTEKKADLQEADGAYLASVREVYLQLAESDANWHRLDCVTEGGLRSIEDIHEELMRVVRTKANL